MSTILRGYTSIDNDSYLKSSGLPIELNGSKGSRTDFVIDITDKDFKDFQDQIIDTITFLTSNYARLLEIKNKVPEIKWEIDYGYNPKITTGELAVEGLHLPLQLLRMCSDLEIEIVVSLYDGKLFD